MIADGDDPTRAGTALLSCRLLYKRLLLAPPEQTKEPGHGFPFPPYSQRCCFSAVRGSGQLDMQLALDSCRFLLRRLSDINTPE